MTEQEAIELIRCEDYEGPETLAEAAEIFEAIFGRRPKAADGDRSMLWSHACAAVQS